MCEKYRAFIVQHVLHNACDFEDRIFSVTRSWPAKALWLCFSPANVDCIVRRACAKEILWKDPLQERDDIRIPLRLAFEGELRAAMNTGELDVGVWECMADLADTWPSNTQIVEGANKVYQNIVDAAPHISLPLKSARLIIKYGPAGWKTSARENFLEACQSMHGQVMSEREDPHRWGLVDDSCAAKELERLPQPMSEVSQRQ